jgi:hypothetical protein
MFLKHDQKFPKLPKASVKKLPIHVIRTLGTPKSSQDMTEKLHQMLYFFIQKLDKYFPQWKNFTQSGHGDADGWA